MEDKRRLEVAIGVAAVVLILMLVFYFITGSTTDMFLVLSIVNALLIILIFIFLIFNIRESKKKGLPMHDEMSKKFAHKAGYISWFISMYTAIAIMFINIAVDEKGPYYMTADRILPILVIFPGITYIILMFHFRAKGIRE